MTAEVPPDKDGGRTAARIQYELVAGAPYRFTSDDAVFAVHAEKHGAASKELAADRERFFAKGQPCLRSSPLAKRYGWGIHSNADGRVAIYPIGSDDYRALVANPRIRRLKAMRWKRG